MAVYFGINLGQAKQDVVISDTDPLTDVAVVCDASIVDKDKLYQFLAWIRDAAFERANEWAT